jgi:hypothetical protein
MQNTAAHTQIEELGALLGLDVLVGLHHAAAAPATRPLAQRVQLHAPLDVLVLGVQAAVQAAEPPVQGATPADVGPRAAQEGGARGGPRVVGAC